jgi:gliding motility-associated-like protein
MKNVFVILFQLGFLLTSHAQSMENRNWYFGNYAGLQFRHQLADTVRNSAMFNFGGSSSISNASGELQFYTNGATVWNKNHQLMANGSGILCTGNAWQAAVVIPKPGSSNQYYLFSGNNDIWDYTIQNIGGIVYSVVDMAPNAGLGAVTQKNIRLTADTTMGGMTAIKHCNNRDYWLITHRYNSDEFNVYLIDATGVHNTPLTQHLGTNMVWPFYGLSSYFLKASPDRSLIAATCSATEMGTSFLELFRFNNSTGMLSLFLKTSDAFLLWPSGYFGAEFSPDGRRLYTSHSTVNYSPDDRSTIFQFDLTNAIPAAIIGSKTAIDTIQFPNTFGFPQLAPNGKIYFPVPLNEYIPYISFPNVGGTGCQLIKEGIRLRNARLTLPHITSSQLYNPITVQGNCQTQTMQFSFATNTTVNQAHWNFGDPASGLNNTSSLFAPTHSFSSPGTFLVELILYNATGCTDTIRKWVSAYPFKPDLGPDRILCEGQSLQLSCVNIPPGTAFSWNTGSRDSTILVSQGGEYRVTASFGDCIAYDTINISINNIPVFSLGNDTMGCEGDHLILKPTPTIGSANYLWNTGAVTDSLIPTVTGLYWLQVSRQGCIYRDSVFVLLKTTPFVHLGNDTTLCNQNSLVLDASFPGTSHLWSTGSTQPTIQVTQAGTYRVTNQLNGCIDSDTIVIAKQQNPTVELGPDRRICAGSRLTLQPQTARADQFIWNTGETTPAIQIQTSGLYRLLVSNFCGEKADSITIKPGICQLYVPSAFSPNGDGLNDFFNVVNDNEQITGLELSVYNRWGQLLIQTTDVSVGWDGRFKGMPQPSGAYAWMLKFQADGRKQLMKGTVMLIK